MKDGDVPGYRKLVDLLGVDLRSLGALRIGIATHYLADLAIRATALRAHYTDFGVMPRAPILSDGRQIHFGFPSLHMLGGSWEFEAFLFVIAALLGALLLVGYRTQAMTPLCWFAVVSVQHRNPLIVHGEDVLLACVLFFAMFLPWGRRFSLDALRRAPHASPTTVLSAGSAGYTLQVAFVYLFSALQKTGPEWRSDGTALYYALGTEGIVRPFGRFLWQFEELLTVGTWATIAFEFAVPLLLFFPFRTSQIRAATLVGIAGMQTFIAMSFSLGLFPLINIIALVGLLPGPYWDRVSRTAGPTRLARMLSDWLRPYFQGTAPAAAPHSGADWVGRAFEFVPAAALAYITATNLASLSPPAVEIPRSVQNVAIVLRLDQIWSTFAPSPYRDGGWFVMPGRLRSGIDVDVFRDGAPLSWEKPEQIERMFPIYRWHKYARSVLGDRDSLHVELWAQYLCRAFNERRSREEQLEDLRIAFVRDRVLPNYQRTAPEQIFLWEHRCGVGGHVPRASTPR